MEQKLVRVPFNLEQAKKITNGEVDGKVVTREGDSVRILCWDKKDKTYPLVALVDDGTEEGFKSYTNEGVWNTDKNCTLEKYDLMLEIPEYMTFKDGDVISFGNTEDRLSVGIFKKQAGAASHECYAMLSKYGVLNFDVKPLTYNNARFATESEKQKLIDALKASKEPKAKDCLKILGIEQKQKYEFKPFDKVLVRYNDKAQWCARFFDRMFEGVYACTDALAYTHCIPYNEQTQHLHGTDENWEE